MRLLFVGDIVGRAGRKAVTVLLPQLKESLQPHFVIANGENAAGGLGLVPKACEEIFAAGVDLLTGGNHSWDKKEGWELLATNERIIRPYNYPSKAPGKGIAVLEKDALRLVVLNLQGRVFMEPVADNPFFAADTVLEQYAEDVILVDFHAEATAEKQALAFYLDGRVAAFIGTHTHVPTADTMILPLGTAYQSDAGMVGAAVSIIGMKKEPIIESYLSGLHYRFEVASEKLFLDSTFLEIDCTQRRAISIRAQRFYLE